MTKKFSFYNFVAQVQPSAIEPADFDLGSTMLLISSTRTFTLQPKQTAQLRTIKPVEKSPNKIEYTRNNPQNRL